MYRQREQRESAPRSHISHFRSWLQCDDLQQFQRILDMFDANIMRISDGTQIDLSIVTDEYVNKLFSLVHIFSMV